MLRGVKRSVSSPEGGGVSARRAETEGEARRVGGATARRRGTVISAALLLLAAGCATPADPASPPLDANLTAEEAGFLAKGELFRIYGAEADPVIVRMTVTVDTFAGQPAWRLDTVVEVTVDGRVEARNWRFWVGLDDSGRPVVLEAAEVTQAG